MKFNRRGRLDTSEVSDKRGMPSGGTLAAGGGIMGIIVVVLMMLMGGNAGGGLPAALDDLNQQSVGPSGPAPESDLGETCQTGADANEHRECALVAAINSIQDYWTEAAPNYGFSYRPATTTFFTGQVSTGCGTASSAVGPFYCPAGEGVYVDLGFFDELESRFGAEGGLFAEAYVLGHEYGHHVQNIVGASQRAHQRGDNRSLIALELQADCYAGVWTHHATTVDDPTLGEPLIVELSERDIALALDAAAAVGDDRIQERTTGRVNPEQWTHGSSEQRQRWFMVGYDSGRPEDCDTGA